MNNQDNIRKVCPLLKYSFTDSRIFLKDFWWRRRSFKIVDSSIFLPECLLGQKILFCGTDKNCTDSWLPALKLYFTENIERLLKNNNF